MSFLESVIIKTRQMEGLLESKYGAAGKGLHEKAVSVENRLGDALVKKIHYIAAIRNKLVHQDGYIFDDDEDTFLDDCDKVIASLKRGSESSPPREVPPIRKPSPYNYPDNRYENGHSRWHYPVSPAKPWYRSTAFLVLTFFLLPPLWAVLILSDKDQGCVLKVIVLIFFFIPCSCCTYYWISISGIYPNIFSDTSSINSLPTNTPKQTGESPHGQPTPSVIFTCKIVWEEYEGEDLAGKNRSMVWEEIVSGHVKGSGMTAQQFYKLVVEKNPGLVTDSYEFFEDNTYYLPACKP